MLLVSGYSFQDQHINELIFNAAARRERSSFVAFCFEGIPDALGEIALTTPAIAAVAQGEAIWGGVRAPWMTTEDLPDDLFEDGKLRLVVFQHLAGHLARDQPPEEADD